ncbi:MAG TPA: glycosyltransferase family 2 protein [Pirellulales bacterium]|nr:glycosyltransferase family 2 protein [Pirellulales bacterium]
MNVAEVILFGSFFWAAFGYALYPILIWTASRLCGRAEQPPAMDDGALPSLTLLIVAHNEEQVLAARLENALAIDYPREKLQVVVASDGSRDGTAQIARSFADCGVRLLDYQPNRGKSATLNAAWQELTTDLVLLSDANTFTAPDAARRLARWFASPEVGAVCGRLVLIDPQSGNNVDGLYWKYETFLKKCEARLGALLGANGAIYAIRREAFVAIPPETIVDDFVIPLLAKLKTGCRLIYAADAVAHEETPPGIADEFRRRVRIGAGGFQSLGVLWPFLHPRHGWLAFSFWSHKVLRWFCPFFLLAAFLSNLLLLAEAPYRATMAAQAVFYAVAWLGGRVPLQGAVGRLIRLTTMFGSMNAALLLGFFRLLSGRQRGAWQRTARTG